MNASCHMYERLISQVRIRHGINMNASRHIYECVMSRILTRYFTYMNESCHEPEQLPPQHSHFPEV